MIDNKLSAISPFMFERRDGGYAIKLFWITYDKGRNRFDKNGYVYTIGIELSANLFYPLLVWFSKSVV